jgi:SAM-dependent methyltransferase
MDNYDFASVKDDVIAILAYEWTPLIMLLVCFIAFILRLLLSWWKPKKSGYESPQYWDVRYKLSKIQKIDAYEWYFVDKELLDFGKEVIEHKQNRVLDLGCGQSTYADQLYDFGFKNIICTDYSEVCIKERKRLNRRDKLEFMKVDGRDMPFPDASFDTIIEKATFDSIIFKRDKQSKMAARKVLAECARVLKPGGRLLSISINNNAVWDEYVNHPDLVIDKTMPNKRIVRKLNDEAMNFYIYTVRRR